MNKESILISFYNRVKGNALNSEFRWTEEVETLYKKGIALDNVLHFVHFENPSLDEFVNWVQKMESKVEVDVNKEHADALTAEELLFFEEHGYVVLKNALPLEACIKTQEVIWQFLEMSPDDSATWYNAHPAQRGLMVNFFDHPVLETNRASLRIKKAYEQLYQTSEIYKTIDKISFNPPVTNGYTFKGSSLHWDVSLQLPIPFRLQGLIYLSDCGEADGAFHCVSGFHKKIDTWMSTVPQHKKPRDYALETLVPEPIVANAGDMVIWHQALPHCATPNYGIKPRLVQYLTYYPETYQAQEVWI